MGYSSDLTDKEWDLIGSFFEQKRVFGRPIKHKRRIIVNAIFYLNKTGCQWRFLPKDFPPSSTVYDYYKQWSLDGTWEKVLDLLNEKDRLKSGRSKDPSYGIADSQSVKTQYNSDDRGIDGGKKGKRP